MKRNDLVLDMLKWWTKDETVCMNKRMSSLLSFIEDQGMRPPCDNSCNPDTYPEGTVFRSCNYEWEEEDEVK